MSWETVGLAAMAVIGLAMLLSDAVRLAGWVRRRVRLWRERRRGRAATRELQRQALDELERLSVRARLTTPEARHVPFRREGRTEGLNTGGYVSTPFPFPGMLEHPTYNAPPVDCTPSSYDSGGSDSGCGDSGGGGCDSGGGGCGE
jgi:uncharacterized membrane protein YgcG